MPKKSIEINPFDGGLNNFADARDIKENELATATNINTDQPGRIRIGKRIHSVAARTGIADIQAGLGLFHYNSDYASDSSEGNTEYQVIFNTSTNALMRRTTSDTNWTALSSLGAAYTPCYYSIDGNLKLSDQSLSADSKFFGVTDVDYFGEAQSNFFTSTNAYIDPPTDGDLTKDPADETDVPPSQNTGHLDWIVQKKSGSVSQWFNFDQNDGNNTALATGSSIFPAIWLNKPHSSEFPITTNSAYNSNSAVVLTSDGSINAQSGKMLKVRGSSGIASFLSIVFRFSAVKSYEEKSIFLDFYFPAASKNALESEALKVRLGNNITQTGSGGNDAYVYLVGSDQINADAWTTLEFVHGQHDEVEGSPNGSAIDMVKIDTHYQNDLDSLSNDGVYYLDNLTVGESSRGLWNGRYKFFQSYIYDETQESNTFLLNGQSTAYEVENKILEFRCHGLRGSGAAMAGNRRVTGANLYYVEYDIDGNPLDTDKKLLINVDLERGIKKVSGETFEAWGDAKGTDTGFEAPRNGTNTAYLQIMDPPVLETFSTKAGYDEDDKLQKMKYKSAVVMNRRAYVGNVKITNPAGKETKHSDRVYKSEPNMPDVFTEYGYVDVAINDGESITALASFGDMLLQFKERTLYLINCTQEIEYLEDTAKYRGVWGQSAVCETDAGIVWVNKFGLFMFDGREIIPLIESKIDPDNWNSTIGSKPVIGFTPIDRKIFVVGDSDNASKGFTYSLKSQGFNFLTGASAGNLFTADMTNLVSSNEGVLSWYQDSGSNITEYKWDAATGDVYIDIKTRDQDFKDPARRKMVKNVYITYKLSEDEGGTSIPTIKYLTNGGSTEYAFNAPLQKNHSDWYTQVLKPNVSSEANNVYSFQVRIYGDTFEGFEINDINVVYRDKVLK